MNKFFLVKFVKKKIKIEVKKNGHHL